LPGAGELFKMVVLDAYRSSNGEELDERKTISKLIEEQETILSNARRKYAKEEMEADDFKVLKAECLLELRKLENKLEEIPAKKDNLKTIEGLLDILIAKYSNITQYYNNEGVEEKRKIISSMYPKNLCFDGTEYRTLYLSEPMSAIYLINSKLTSIKKGKSCVLTTFPLK
jgi:site-specific DNA recombinase